MSVLAKTVPLVDNDRKNVVEQADWGNAQNESLDPSKSVSLADLSIIAAHRNIQNILAPRIPPSIHLTALTIPRTPEPALPRGPRRRAKSHSLPRRGAKPPGTRVANIENWIRSEPHLGFLGEVTRPKHIHLPSENIDTEADEPHYEPRVSDNTICTQLPNCSHPDGQQSPEITAGEQTNWVSSPAAASLPTEPEEDLVKIGKKKRRMQKNAIQASQLSIK